MNNFEEPGRGNKQNRSESLGMRNRNFKNNNLTFTNGKQSAHNKKMNKSESRDLQNNSREKIR